MFCSECQHIHKLLVIAHGGALQGEVIPEHSVKVHPGWQAVGGSVEHDLASRSQHLDEAVQLVASRAVNHQVEPAFCLPKVCIARFLFIVVCPLCSHLHGSCDFFITS